MEEEENSFNANSFYEFQQDKLQTTQNKTIKLTEERDERDKEGHKITSSALIMFKGNIPGGKNYMQVPKQQRLLRDPSRSNYIDMHQRKSTSRNRFHITNPNNPYSLNKYDEYGQEVKINKLTPKSKTNPHPITRQYLTYNTGPPNNNNPSLGSSIKSIGYPHLDNSNCVIDSEEGEFIAALNVRGNNSFLSETFKDTSFGKNFCSNITPTHSVNITPSISYQFKNKQDITYYLQNAINNSTQEITFPNSNLEIETLIIKNNIIIKGTNTKLLVRGTISITPNTKAEFQECDIELIPPKLSTNEFRALSLFSVCRGANLRLINCHLQSLVFGSKVRGKGGTLEDAGIWLEPRDIDMQKGLDAKDIGGAVLRMESCSIKNFYMGIFCGSNSRCIISQSQIDYIQSSCLLALNPIELTIRDSSFKECGGVAIDIRLVNGPEVDSNIPLSYPKSQDENENTEELYAKISIEACEISKIEKAGIAIYSDDSQSPPICSNLKISLKANAINKNAGEAIYAKDIIINSFIITNNELSFNSGCSIALNNVKTIENNIISNDNLCNNSALGYGVLAINTLIDLSTSECLMNKKGGIFVVGGNEREGEINNMSISNCKANNNSGHGIGIVDTTNIIHLHKCETVNNKDFGIVHSLNKKRYSNTRDPYMSSAEHFWKSTSLVLHTAQSIQRENSQISLITTNTTQEDFEPSKLEIDQCEIMDNQKGGIYLCNGRLHINKAIIKENNNFAINLPYSEKKKVLTFSKYSMKEIYISGIVGGNWGMYKQSLVYYPKWAISSEGHSNKKCSCFCWNKRKKKGEKDTKQDKTQSNCEIF